MKVIFKILLACGLLVWLALPAMREAENVFLQDMVQLHGASLTGVAVSAAGTAIDWRQKTLRIATLEVANTGAYSKLTHTAVSALHAGDCSLQLPAATGFDRSTHSFLPSVLPVELLEMRQVVLYYDIDSEGGNLRDLRMPVSAAASIGLKDRINAAANGGELLMPLFRADMVRVTEIQVDARSMQNPSRNKVFPMRELVLRDVGKLENGVTFAEVVDRTSRALMDEVQREALAQGVIEIKRPVVPKDESVKKRRATVADETEDASAEKQEGGVKKAAHSVGKGFKDLGHGISRGFKQLFD